MHSHVPVYEMFSATHSAREGGQVVYCTCCLCGLKPLAREKKMGQSLGSWALWVSS